MIQIEKLQDYLEDIWNQLGQIGLNFLNIIPKLGKVVYEFFGTLFTDLFHGIYNQQIEPQKAKKVIVGIVGVAVISSIVFSGVSYLSGDKIVKKQEIKKELKVKKPEIKKEVKKPDKKRLKKE